MLLAENGHCHCHDVTIVSFKCQFGTNLESSEKDEVQLNNCPIRLPCGHVCGTSSLLSADVKEPPSVGDAIPRQVVLSCTGKAAEQIRWSKLASSALSWSLL